MRRALCRSFFVAVISLSCIATGQSVAEGVKGRFDLQDGTPVIIADQVYLVTSSTQIVDREQNHITLDSIYPGRGVEVESAITLGEWGKPVATHITVSEPH